MQLADTASCSVSSSATLLFIDYLVIFTIGRQEEVVILGSSILLQAGADIFRLNCSHRRGGDFERVYPLIRKTAKELGKKALFGRRRTKMFLKDAH